MKKEFKRFFGSFKKWSIWVTITFRKTHSVEIAEKKFKRLFKYLNQPFQQFYKNYVYALVFYEKNLNRPGVHIHAVLDGIDENDLLLLEILKKKCEECFGESEVKPIHEDVMEYLSEKYNSNRLEHYDLYKINSRLRDKRQCLKPKSKKEKRKCN